MNIDQIINLDQRLTLAINGSDSLFWDNVMYVVTNTFSWSLVIVMLIVILFRNNNWKEFFLILLFIGLMLAFADQLCSGISKPMFARWRPTQDPQLMYMIDTVRDYRGGRYGFFSGHACNTSCMAMFLAWLFRSGKVTFTLFFWSVTTTFTRLYLGVHYLGDVTVGFTLGCIIGFVFYLLMHRMLNRIHTSRLISEQFTSSGYLKDDMNMFLAVVFFNYVCVVIFAMTLGIA